MFPVAVAFLLGVKTATDSLPYVGNRAALQAWDYYENLRLLGLSLHPPSKLVYSNRKHTGDVGSIAYNKNVVIFKKLKIGSFDL